MWGGQLWLGISHCRQEAAPFGQLKEDIMLHGIQGVEKVIIWPLERP